MATLTATIIGNIFDVLKLKLPDGSAISSIVNSLAERDDFMAFTPAFPANNGLTHHALRTVTLPTGYLVDIGGSWKASKSEREPFVEALLTIKSTYQAPTDTFTTEKPEVGQKLMQAEKIDHVMMLNQSLSNIILQGPNSSGTNQPNMSGIVGLMQRAPYTAIDNKFTFDAGGGAGINLRSIWMMKPGVDTVHYLYNPNHPTLGIGMQDKGEVHINGLGTSADEHRWDLLTEFELVKGIFIRDQRAVKRIANIPAGPDDIPGADLINSIIRASIINAPTGGIMQVEANGRVTDLPAPWIAYCDEWTYSHLVIGANDKLKVHTSNSNIYQTDLPMIGPNIIIARWDALNKVIDSGEDQIS